MQLKVVKADGSIEQYMHTKVVGTFANALAIVGELNIFAAEQFAEAVTYHIHQDSRSHAISSDRIHLMVQAVLNATGFANAARAINEYRLCRDLKRRRIEVIKPSSGNGQAEPWDKTKIVHDLIKNDGLGRPLARAIASAVEQRVLNLGMTKISPNLIKQLVMADTEAMLHADMELAAAGT